LSVLGDIATVIPGIGEGIQTSRLAKAAAKMGPLLLKGLKAGAIVGIGADGVALLESIANGEKLDVDDYRRMFNILNGARVLNNTGIKSPKTKEVVSEFGEFKSADGKSIKPNNEALTKIKNAKKSDQLRVAKKEILAAHKAAYGNDGLTDPQILGLYEIPVTTKRSKGDK
jgi:hypothetical protein